MEENIINENMKRIKIGDGCVRKIQSARVYPETLCVGRQEDGMEEGEHDVSMMSEGNKPGVDVGNCYPEVEMVSLDSSSVTTVKGANYHHQSQYGKKSHSVTKEFVEQDKYFHSQKGGKIYSHNDEYKEFESSSKRKENLLRISDDEEDSTEAAIEQEETIRPSVKYNFGNPLMAINYSEAFKSTKENYTKGCKWSPDGSCLLVAANDSKLRLFNLPTPVLQGTFLCSESWFVEESEKYCLPAVTAQEKEVIYDYCWYPLMSSDIPSTCCFVATCRHQPIHLWDAWDGHLICSYHPYNHLDEMVAAYSIGFNLDGSRMVAGFKKCLRTFHTSRPGRYFEVIPAKDQPGIISCTSFNPQLQSVFAAGSYLGTIGLYNLERNNLFCRIDGDMGGVTQVQFSSCGTKLFSGSRKNNKILCWDIRNLGTLLCGYKREVSTNQRIQFDLEPQGNSFLVSGDTGGRVLKWDLTEGWEAACEDEFTKEPSTTFMAHNDSTNGVSIHPYCPLLATSSGKRHFPQLVADSDVDSSSDSEEPRALFTTRGIVKENAVKLWWIGGL